MADFAPEVKRHLLDHGCEYKRPAKGDHEWWWSPITKRHFAVDHKIKSRAIRPMKY